ncbi:hypothetical protein Pmani_024946 [Petrolisthes manimaculis]|uniref:Uncharacterized protein n=1 Tax=Petrolisthes manimaculis TaxID=1843537 RepID=A0AAE1P6K5_9EUCA|nr:hypothetical protein Pmani_024946 [Petrolisthes manimaculis]
MIIMGVKRRRMSKDDNIRSDEKCNMDLEVVVVHLQTSRGTGSIAVSQSVSCQAETSLTVHGGQDNRGQYGPSGAPFDMKEESPERNQKVGAIS